MLSYFLKKALRRHDEKNNLKVKTLIREAILENATLTSTAAGVGNDKAHNIVVSLTSFDQRIDNLHICIESLFQQSLKADKIVLWLSRKNFTNKKLPENIIRLQARGLSVEWVDDDIGPYKKIIYSLQAYPDALIITVDDDVLYPSDTIDMLYQSYLERPTAIHCHRAYTMPYSGNRLVNYQAWPLANNASEPAYDIFPTGIAGVLYFPGCFDKEVANQAMFMRLCPNADDVWLKAMSLKAGTKVYKVNDSRPWKDRFLTVPNSQDASLKRLNWSKKHGNDEKIAAVFDHYQLYEYLHK